MAYRGVTQQSEHDWVIGQWAGMYTGAQQDGYQISTNPGSSKNRFVGGDQNRQYPDVIVWKPDAPGSTDGQASSIDEIETADSVNEDEARGQWLVYGRLGIPFRLVLPWNSAAIALALTQNFRITVKEIWGYLLTNGQITFRKYYG